MTPEEVHLSTPEHIEISRVTAIRKEETEHGIVLQGIDELMQALDVYGSGMIEGSNAANEVMFGPDADGFMSAEEERTATKFLAKVKSKASEALAREGRYEGFFGMEAKKTPFFTTQLLIDKYWNRFFMQIATNYAGTSVEDKLAETLAAERGMVSASANLALEVIRNWWYKLDLKSTIGRLARPEHLMTIAQHLIWERDIEIKLPYNNNGYWFRPRIDADLTLKTAGCRYICISGTHIIGGAWTNWDERGAECPARIIEPKLKLTVHNGRPALDAQEKQELMAARDHLIERIKNPYSRQ